MHTELCGSFYGREWIGVETVGDDEECQSLNLFAIVHMGDWRRDFVQHIPCISRDCDGDSYRH